MPEVAPGQAASVEQSTNLESDIPLTLSYDQGPAESLFPSQGTVCIFYEDYTIQPTVASEKAPRLMGIGRDQSESTLDKLGATWNLNARRPDWELRYGHRQGDIARLRVVLEGAAVGDERFLELDPFECGCLGSRQAEQQRRGLFIGSRLRSG
jgi:hypothetical protein